MKAIDYEEENTKRGNWLDITGGSAKDSLTVLDYFAGKALDAAFRMVDHNEEEFWLGSDEETVRLWKEGDENLIAANAYNIAEAMLRERNERFTPQNVVRGVTGKTYG